MSFKSKTLHTLSLIFIFLLSSNNVLARECYDSTIVSPTPFAGIKKDIFKLSDGTIWEVEDAYAFLNLNEPSITICPDQGELIVKDRAIKVALIAIPNALGSKKRTLPSSKWEMYEETNLQGTLIGNIETDRVLKTVSGNIYEIIGYTFQFVLKHEPEVTILRHDDIYKLIDNGFDEPLICRKIN